MWKDLLNYNTIVITLLFYIDLLTNESLQEDIFWIHYIAIISMHCSILLQLSINS